MSLIVVSFLNFFCKKFFPLPLYILHIDSLGDGLTVYLDANYKPIINDKGIICKNERGHWKALCANDISFSNNGAEKAGAICTILGFK